MSTLTKKAKESPKPSVDSSNQPAMLSKYAPGLTDNETILLDAIVSGVKAANTFQTWPMPPLNKTIDMAEVRCTLSDDKKSMHVFIDRNIFAPIMPTHITDNLASYRRQHAELLAQQKDVENQIAEPRRVLEMFEEEFSAIEAEANELLEAGDTVASQKKSEELQNRRIETVNQRAEKKVLIESGEAVLHDLIQMIAHAESELARVEASVPVLPPLQECPEFDIEL